MNNPKITTQDLLAKIGLQEIENNFLRERIKELEIENNILKIGSERSEIPGQTSESISQNSDNSADLTKFPAYG